MAKIKNFFINCLAGLGKLILMFTETPYEGPVGYVIRRWKRILAASLISFIPTLFLVSNTFMTIARNNKNVFNDIINSGEFENAAWGTLFIYLPILISVYLVMCFGGDTKKEDKYTVYTPVGLFIAISASYFILSHGHTEIYGAVDRYLTIYKASDYFQFFVSLVLITYGATFVKVHLFIKDGGPYKHPWFVKSGMCLLSSIMSYIILEVQLGSHLNVDAKMLFFNILYWMIAWMLLYSIFRNIRLPSVLCVIGGWVVGVANFCVLQFRGNYIMSGDLTAAGTALEVAGKYKLKVNFYFILAILILLVTLAFIYSVPKVKTDVKRGVIKRGISTIVSIGVIAAIVIPTFNSGAIYNGIFGLKWDYNKQVDEYGYLPYFFSNLHATARIDMSDYDVSLAKNAMDTELGKSDVIAPAAAGKEPTIIIIQDEAFSDLSVVANYKTDKEVAPFFKSLTKNTHKGYVNMSVTGGPTANTEFELLSQTSMAYMPTGSVPYTQYLKRPIPSIVQMLKNQAVPYHTIAFHPYYSSGYNRQSVYDLIGFDEKVFYDDFSKMDQLRGLVTDKKDFDDMIKMYEDHKKSKPDEPLFIFNVTIQNHGGYSNNKVYFKDPVEITSFDSVQALDNYISLIRTTDDALRDFIGYFEKQKDPVIVLFYGDHQPSFDADATEQLTEHSIYKDPAMQKLSRYIVPYFIWANYDIGSSDKIHEGGLTGEYNQMSMNYLGSYVLKYAGVKLPDYTRYLLKLHEDVPAVTALGYWDNTGKHFENSVTSALTEQLTGLKNVSYNLLLDHKDKLDDYFLPKASAAIK